MKRRILSFTGAGIFLLAIWQIASILLAKTLLPSPVTVFQAIPDLVQRDLFHHLGASLWRITLGMVLAVLLGFLLGLLIASLPRWKNFFDPLVYLTYPIPKMALLPIVMLLGGLGDLSKVIMIVLIVMPQVLVAVRDAIEEIPEHYYDVYRVIGASSWQRFGKITFPATLPAIFSTSRVSLGTAISILFFTENYGTEFGMGYFIMDAWMRMDYPAMYAAILILSLLGLVLFVALDLLAKGVMPWRKSA